MSTLTTLSPSQVSVLPDDQWINDSAIEAYVLKLDAVPKKTGGQFWKATLGDGLGNYTKSITLSCFQAPKFQLEDFIRISGKGLKKTSYQGKAQLGLGKESVVEVIPSSKRVVSETVNHIAQVKEERAQEVASNLIDGQTVGMAMKEALAIHTKTATFNLDSLSAPSFWNGVYTTSSDIIRISRLLKSGKLADPVKARGAAPTRQAPAPTHDPERELNAELEDVPF